MLSARYSFLVGKNKEDVPFAVYVEDEHGRVVYSSGIHVDESICDIPEELADFCASSPFEKDVMDNVGRLVSNSVAMVS